MNRTRIARIVVTPEGYTRIQFKRRNTWYNVCTLLYVNESAAIDQIKAYDKADHRKTRIVMIATGYFSHIRSKSTIVHYNIDPTVTIPTIW